jgi:shikimate kinase
MKPSNIVLIGMPGSGKSTVGPLLAKRTYRDFVDTDVLIQASQGRPLQDIVDAGGHRALKKIEEKVLLALDCHHHVIATGGSAAYSHAAMQHLKADGVIVFLHVDLPTLKQRIRDYDTRGLARRPDQSFADLFRERSILYEKYAEITVNNTNVTPDEACKIIVNAFSDRESGVADSL